MTRLDWSPEIEFLARQVRRVPADPGVYEIRQSMAYPRYRGCTRVLKIGMSERSLRKELESHFSRHTAANRLGRLRALPDAKIVFAFATCPAVEAELHERMLLRQFEDQHWDLPVLNAQRGYARDEDRHYRGFVSSPRSPES